ncbi:MAG: hypothetical protein R2809_06205 [Flavobacteriales bacterium]
MMVFFFNIVSVFTALFSFNSEAEHIKADQLGYLYSIHETTFSKTDTKGNIIFKNSSLDYGEATSIDLTNPFQPFIFYKDQGKLAVLDNTLSLQGDVVDFFEKGYGNIECVGGSRGDAFWLWDVNKTELIKVDKQFNRLISTGNLSLLLEKKINPSQIIERGNFLYIADPSLGVLVFDIYGNYRNTITIEFDGKIAVDDQYLTFIKGNSFYLSDIKGLSPHEFSLPITAIEDWDFVYPNLYLLSQHQILSYKMNP